jgi:predicted  nucleic acid-binding Zn-ribbon protein
MQYLPTTIPSVLKACLAAVLALALTACSAESPDTTAPVAEADDMANAHESFEAVQEEANDLRNALARFSVDQQEEAQQEIDAAMGRVEQRFTAIETRIENRWDNLSETARMEADKQLDRLRRQKTEFAAAYSDVASDSETAWERLQDGFADAYAELDNAFSEAERELGLDS